MREEGAKRPGGGGEEMLTRLAVLLVFAILMSACGGLVEVKSTATVVLTPPAETSAVLAADGTILAELHAEQDRELVSLSVMPQSLQDAVVAVEDARFYEHAGVDARAIARAVWKNASEGRIVQGGSTITQQLAKNAVTGDERTLARKLSEASAALQLESKMTKEEILERYLNTVYFGNGTYGVQAASQRYFGVDVSELDLSQAALLAGLLRSPSAYDPFAQPVAARRRRDLVLDLMKRQQLVPSEEVEAAKEAPLELAAAVDEGTWKAPYFVSHVLHLLQHDDEFAALGQEPKDRADRVFRGGLKIETTLDTGWQQAAEQALAQTLSDPEDPRGAIAAIDPATGGVSALVGGRDYDDPDDPTARFNLATDGRRQPGSTFKPLVLAAALAEGHELDERYPAPGRITIPPHAPEEPEPWVVSNYDDVAYGDMTLREATAQSVNVVYAQLVEEIGAEAVVDIAHAAGITQPLSPLRSIALGAQEVSVLEMASVQATLAAGGIYRAPSAITRITASDGTVLYERANPQGERVLDETVAWLTTQALEEVIDHGTGDRAGIRRPVAGKTGTTQDSADAWFTGYTPDLAAAVWIGFPEGRVPMEPPTTRIRVEGGNWPAEAFARFALRALEDTPAGEFPIPDEALTRVRIDTTRGCLPNRFTPRGLIAERSFLSGTEPTDVCPEPSDPPVDALPDVVGMPLDAAQRELSDAGFTVEHRARYTVETPPGYVMGQTPPPGQARTLTGGYVVTLDVSSADRQEVAVPDVLGLPAADAVAALEAAGFLVETARECPDGTLSCTGSVQLPGRVWEQSPEAGMPAVVHTSVRLAVYPDGS